MTSDVIECARSVVTARSWSLCNVDARTVEVSGKNCLLVVVKDECCDGS